MKELLERLVLCVERLRESQEPGSGVIVHDNECAWERNDGACNCSSINVDRLLSWARHAATTIEKTPEVEAAEKAKQASVALFWASVPLYSESPSTEAFEAAISAAIAYGAAKLQNEQEAEWPPLEEVDQNLRDAGLDPEKVAEHGLALARTIQENVALKKLIERLEWHLRLRRAVKIEGLAEDVDGLIFDARKAIR